MSEFTIEIIDAPIRVRLTQDIDIEFVDADSIKVASRSSKPKLYFDGGSYLRNSPHYRDGWQDDDHLFWASLVRVKVTRINNRGKVAILDDIIEFRKLTAKFAAELCESLKMSGAVFAVYHDGETYNG